MPYKSIGELPDNVKNLPAEAKEIYMKAFNSAWAQRGDTGQDEAKCHATAWSAVEKKFKKVDDKWVVKESMSMDDIRSLLQSSLEQKFPSSNQVMPSGAWIVDVFDTELVYRVDGIDYKMSYVINFESEVTFGEPVKVKRQTVYTPIESLRNVYSQIINEAGKRNASADAGRIKKIMELCQELLDKEPSEDETKEALKKASECLEWLKLQEVMKTDDGEKFPAQAYAYVPSDNVSEWKLRLWENPTLKVTRKQLGAAAAALSPGGFRGQRVDIPKEDLPAVKRKIRAEYRKLDVEVEDMPKWVKESETRDILNTYVSLEEAVVGAKGIAKVVIIKPGFGNAVDNHYYPVETLSRDYAAFEGAKMYSDHQTAEEEKSRPEGSIRQWVASLKNVRFEEGVGIVGDAVIIEPWLQSKLATLRDQKLLSEMGISIRAAGVGTKGKIDGKDTNVVERITRVRSVDFVTEAGAGGGVLLYEHEKEFDVDVVTLEALKERRPDLVKLIETETKTITLKEVKMSEELQAKVTELEGNIATLTTERDELKTKFDEAEKAQKIAEAKSVVDEAVGKSELPEAAKARIVEKFKEAETSDGVEDAIKAEKDYIEALKESGKPKDLGGSQPDKEKSKAALKESFMRLGMTKEQATEAASVR